jgi:hypothetical protein
MLGFFSHNVYGWPLKLTAFILFVLAFHSPALAQTADSPNQCDNRKWIMENWGYNPPPTATSWTNSITACDYGLYKGRQCLRANITTCIASSAEACLMVDYSFSPEDWSKIHAIKIDMLIESGSSKDVKIELKNNKDTSFIIVPQSNLATGSWREIEWQMPTTISEPVYRLFFHFEKLINWDVLYFSNLRLIDENGKEILWESFTTPSYDWQGGDNYAFWEILHYDQGVLTPLQGRKEPIAHQQTYAESAAALYIPWDDSLTNSHDAYVEATNLAGLDFSRFVGLKASVRCEGKIAPVNVNFGNSFTTESKSVASLGDWQQLHWEIPYGNFKSWKFQVDTSAGGTGTAYIDDIEFIAPTPTPPSRLEGGAAKPNPFFPSQGKNTTFDFRSPYADYTIKIFNIAGTKVRTLRNEKIWNGRNDSGSACEGGVYLFQIESHDQRVSGQVVLIH